MSSFTVMPARVMTEIVKGFSPQEIAQLETVCKDWQALLRSDEVISNLIKQKFPLYTFKPELSASIQYRRLCLVSSNIARGKFTVSDCTMESSSAQVYENRKYLVEVCYDASLFVTNRRNGHFYVCEGHRVENADLLNRPKITDVQFTPDQRSMITASTDRTLKVWDLESGCCNATYENLNSPILALRISRTGDRAFSICSNGVVKAYNFASRTWSWISNNANFGERLTGFELSQDESFLILSTINGRMFRHQVDNINWYMNQVAKQIFNMVKTPDQKNLLISTNEGIVVYGGLRYSDLIQKIPFPEGMIMHRAENGVLHKTSIAWMRFSQDGTKLVLRGRETFDHSRLTPFATVLDFLNLENPNERLLQSSSPPSPGALN